MFAQVYEPFDFHVDAVAVQCGFGEVVRQRRGHRGVTPIERAKRKITGGKVGTPGGQGVFKVRHASILTRGAGMRRV